MRLYLYELVTHTCLRIVQHETVLSLSHPQARTVRCLLDTSLLRGKDPLLVPNSPYKEKLTAVHPCGPLPNYSMKPAEDPRDLPELYEMSEICCPGHSRRTSEIQRDLKPS